MEDVPVMADPRDDETETETETDVEGPRTEIYLPTLDEIAAECAAIQRGWSPQERERRFVGVGRVEWSVPRGVTGE